MAQLLRLAGLIDAHVHLRDPGQTHKEDFYTGTAAALAGGVTTVFDMPNNARPIFSSYTLQEKMKVAGQKAVCDWGLYFGSDGTNIAEFEKVKDLVVGLKLYLNLTTGKYILENKSLLEQVFLAWPKNKIIVVHAEGEKVSLAIDLSVRYGNKIHVTHIATKSDLANVLAAKDKGLPVTCDVTPHHLFLTTRDFTKLKSYGSVKPTLQTNEDQEYLWKNINRIDCITSDHAPHTRKEKEGIDPPSGMPGLETMLPLLLTAVKERKLTLDDIYRFTNTNPQKIFGVKQHKDSFIDVDLNEHYTITNRDLVTKCGWSPFAGKKVYGRVKKVYIRGTLVFDSGKVLASGGFGKSIKPS